MLNSASTVQGGELKQLRGAVAGVTGAGSGIGRALAQELALAGAQLALADIDGAALEQTLALRSTSARTYQVDVADPSAVDQFALQVHQDFGGASLLINNAGVALYGAFAEFSLADVEWPFRINFWGASMVASLSFPRCSRNQMPTL